LRVVDVVVTVGGVSRRLQLRRFGAHRPLDRLGRRGSRSGSGQRGRGANLQDVAPIPGLSAHRYPPHFPMNGKRNMRSKLSAADCPVNHLERPFPDRIGYIARFAREPWRRGFPKHAEILTLTMREAMA